MLHKPAQKRVYFEGATYFVTCTTHNWVEYFKEPIFCELFVDILRMAKKMHKFELYSFVVLLDHFHLMFCPHKPEDLSKIMQFIKRHFSRNANIVLGCESEEAICKSLLRIRGDSVYYEYRGILEDFYKTVLGLRAQFLSKYGVNQTQFYKFKWLKSFRDHYIRNTQDFEEHLQYIYNNPAKHKISKPDKYQYLFSNYPELIDKF